MNTSVAPTSGADSNMGVGGPPQMGGAGGPRMTGPPMGGGPPQMVGGPPQMAGPGPRGMMMQLGPGATMMPQQQMAGNQMMGMPMNLPVGGSTGGPGGPSPVNRGGPSPIGGIRGASPVSGGPQNPNLDAQQQSRSPLMSPNNAGPNVQGTMSPNGKFWIYLLMSACKF